MSASEHTYLKKKIALVKSDVFSDKVKHPIYQSIRGFLKKLSRPALYIAPSITTTTTNLPEYVAPPTGLTGALGIFSYPRNILYSLHGINFYGYGMALAPTRIYYTSNDFNVKYQDLTTGSAGNIDIITQYATIGMLYTDTLIYVTGNDTNRLFIYNKSDKSILLKFENGEGFIDGNSTTARFFRPGAMCIDPIGNIYICDILNHSIRKMDTSYNITTLAGTGVAGFLDSTNPRLAQFHRPNGICLDSSGNFYITDSYNNRIRKISNTGVVTTIGGNGTAGLQDGNGAANTMFSLPQGICVDSVGNLYVTDTNNNRVRKIDTSQNVTTIPHTINVPQDIKITDGDEYLVVSAYPAYGRIITL